MLFVRSLRIRHIMLLLFALGFLLYSFSFSNSFLWDDEQFIVKNVYVQHLSYLPQYFTTNTIAGAGFQSVYYRPLTTLSFALDNAFWGMHPLPFHVTNAFLHATSGTLLFLVLLLLLRRLSYSGNSRVLALFVSAAFLFHPAQVEAVGFINSRGESLSLLFGLLSLYCFLNLRKKKSENTVFSLMLLTLSFSLFSILSKETGIIWGIMMFALYLLYSVKMKVFNNIEKVTAVLLAGLSAGYFLIRVTILKFQTLGSGWDPVYANSIRVRIATFVFNVIPEYIKILLLPVNLHMERNVSFVTSLQSISPFSALLLTFLVLCTSYLLWYFYRHSQRIFVVLVFSLSWFLIFLAPVSGIIPINGLVYEHWLYVPMIGWWLFWGIVLFHFYQRFPLFVKKIFSVCVILLFFLWVILSIKAIRILHDPLTFYPYTLRFAQTARLHNNLGMTYAEADEKEKSEKEYMAGLSISTVYPAIYHNLGNLYTTEKKYGQAEQMYKKALDVDPTFAFSIMGLVMMNIDRNNYGEAMQWAKAGEERFPKNMQFTQIIQELSHAASESGVNQQLSPEK